MTEQKTKPAQEFFFVLFTHKKIFWHVVNNLQFPPSQVSISSLSRSIIFALAWKWKNEKNASSFSLFQILDSRFSIIFSRRVISVEPLKHWKWNSGPLDWIGILEYWNAGILDSLQIQTPKSKYSGILLYRKEKTDKSRQSVDAVIT